MERKVGQILIVVSICLTSIHTIPLWLALFMAIGGMAWIDK